MGVDGEHCGWKYGNANIALAACKIGVDAMML